MTKKHFEALAAALADCKPILSNDGSLNTALRFGEVQIWLDSVRSVATVCAQFSPKFDRARFFKACGVEG